MILDTLENLKRYDAVLPGAARLADALSHYTAESFVPGRVDVDGDAIYMNFSEYETKPAEGSKFEAHRKYADVMYMVDGCETVYVKDVARLTRVTDGYDPAIEALLADFDGEATAVRLQKGDVLILFPRDAHAPGRIADAPQSVKKIIGKVLL